MNLDYNVINLSHDKSVGFVGQIGSLYNQLNTYSLLTKKSFPRAAEMFETILNLTFEQDLNFKFEAGILTLLNDKPEMPEFIAKELDILIENGIQDFLTVTQAVGMTR